MTQRTISNWRIIPYEGQRVGLVGQCEGRFWRTTHIVAARIENGKKMILTISGTTYFLKGPEEAGMWLLQLQLKRPEQYDNLVKQGIL